MPYMEWKIIVIIILICQFPISVLSLWQLFKLQAKTKVTVIWNVIIMALPVLGALIFWSVLAIKKLAAKKRYEKSDS